MQTIKQKVVIGLSGGVDSAVATYLLQKAGYEVIPVFLKFYSDTKNPLTSECSYLDDLKDARKICAKLGLNLLLVDKEREYKSKVLKPFYKKYEQGKTPNPDLACNSIMKFPFLQQVADKYHANYIATGHYARIKKIGNKLQLLQGLDEKKDQSYFLAQLTEKQLENIIFPLGNMKKEEVRELAKKLGFHNYNKPGTTGICFIGKQDMQIFLKKKIKSKPGKIIDELGNIIGNHPGSQYFTIGQKLGSHLNIELHKTRNLSQKRLYVGAKINNNLVAVTEESNLLYKKDLQLTNLNLLDKIPKKIQARIRHLGELITGKIIKKSNRYHFISSKPVKAPAPGQYLVIYNKQQVIGCAEIL